VEPPQAGRPYPPGYGIAGAERGSGRLPGHGRSATSPSRPGGDVDMKTIKCFLGPPDEKHQTSYTVDFLDAAGTRRSRSSRGGETDFIMLRHDDLSGSPTRWVFDEGAGSIAAAETLE
jgi:hypothetical protein